MSKSITAQNRFTIGLFVDNVRMEEGYQNTVWTGAAAGARQQGADLICFSGGSLLASPYRPFEAQRNVIYEMANEETVDGLVILSNTIGHSATPEQMAAFLARHAPLPVVSIGPAEGVQATIEVDNQSGLFDAILHLAQHHGHRRIAFIQGPEFNRESALRYQAYLDGLEACGLPLDPALVAQGDFLSPSGRAAVELLLDERRADLDALVAANDMMGLGAMRALDARGIRVPQDVAVVGFDDLPDAAASSPSLASVRQPIANLGKQAVETLAAILRGEAAPKQTMIATQFIARQSCGCSSRSEPIKVDWKAPAGSEPDALPTEQREAILPEILRLLPQDDAACRSSAETLVDAFALTVNTRGSQEAFLQILDQVLRDTTARNGDVGIWQQVIGTLCHAALPCLMEDYQALSWATDLCERAWILIGETELKGEAHKRLSARGRATALQGTSEALITTFDIDALMETIAEQLPNLGIKRFSIALYEQPLGAHEQREPGDTYPLSPTWSRIVLAHDTDKGSENRDAGSRFLTRQLLPEALRHLPEPSSLLVEALYFRNERFGYAVFDVPSLPRGLTYATLRTQISSALKGAFLYQERKQDEEALARSNRELVEFAQAASRDLQEPLRMVTGYLTLLEERYQGRLDQDADEFIHFAVDGATRMNRLISDLLTYSRVGIKGKPFERVECQDILDQALDNLKVSVEEADAHITHDDLPAVMGDGVQLIQLFQNLIGNAIKFRHPEIQPEIHVGLQSNQEEYAFSIRDNGIGIDPDHYDRIFMIFQRLHTRDEYEGTGIGLAVCKKIVERHGGRIWVESELGAGSTFHFVLPREKGAPS